jgi:hypothetical protein
MSKPENPVLKEFITRAQEVDFDRAIAIAGITMPKKGEYQGPCPRCRQGVDRFSVNREKGVWNCRSCGGGRDAISLVIHCKDLPARGYGFLEACAMLLGEDIPEGGERESEEDRAARLERIAESERRAEAARAEKDRKQNDFRQKEVDRGRGIWLGAVDCRLMTADASAGARLIKAYLKARTGFDAVETIFHHIRFLPRATYWHGEDFGGRPLALYEGPALVMPIVGPDAKLTGSQTIWIDLNVKEKRRPVLWGLTKEGRLAGFAELDRGGADQPPRDEWVIAKYFEKISSKKMRGSLKGGLMPVAGNPGAARWVCGEGVEQAIAIAGPEGFRDDTFYCAAGSIGNMAGPADPKSAFNHPDIKMTDTRGRSRFVRVQGPVPKPDSEGDAMWIGEHVSELVLIADGDSELVATAAAMARAVARAHPTERQVDVWWPPAGMDFSDAMANAMAQGEDA